MPEEVTKRPINYPLLIILLFLLSRVIFYAAGVRFDAHQLPGFWQLMDIGLMKEKLWESLWFLHGQPPLYNLFNGLVLKIFPINYAVVFHAFHILAGLVTSILLFKILTQTGISKKISFYTTIYYFLTPTCILYENWHFYTYFEILLLTSITWFFIKFFKKQDFKPAFLLFLSMAALVLMRSMFHLAWFLALLIFLIFIFRNYKMLIIKAAIFPLLCILFWFGKNYYLYDKFAASTHLGMNFARIAEPANGIGAIEPFSALDKYYPYIQKDKRYSDVEILHDEIKPNGIHQQNYINYNNINYIQISDLYLEECIAEIKRNPLRYLKHVARSQFLYFDSPTSHWEVGNNFAPINLYALILDGRLINIIYYKITGKYWYNIAVFIFLIHLFVLAAAVFWFYNALKSNSLIVSRKQFYVLCFIIFNVLYVMIIGNLLEYGENYRFKVATAPLFLILVVCSTKYLYGLWEQHILNKEGKKQEVK